MSGDGHTTERILSEADRRDIKSRVGQKCPHCGKPTTQADLAREYGVSDATISYLVNDKKYFR